MPTLIRAGFGTVLITRLLTHRLITCLAINMVLLKGMAKTDRFGNTSCSDCGASYEMVGVAHNCRPRNQSIQIKSEPLQDKPLIDPAPITPDRVDSPSEALSGAARQKRWREANPDVNRKRAREGMRKRRT